MLGTSRITPVLRSFDEAKAREFYVDFLGGEVVFEHRTGDAGPLYLGIRLGGAPLHLTEHFGDASPGTALRIEVEHLEAYLTELRSKRYAHARPDPDTLKPTPWGTLECPISDPFGNRLMFWQALP